MQLIRNAWLALVLVALVTAACGGGSSAAGSGGPSLQVQSPADGDAVSVPFKVEFSTDATLGPPESGDQHIHLYYDGSQDDYEVIDGASFVVSDLAPGEHTLEASLRNADHSPAGAEDSITITVGGGAGKTNDEKGGGYGDYSDY
jgi:hypothetical protein